MSAFRWMLLMILGLAGVTVGAILGWGGAGFGVTVVGIAVFVWGRLQLPEPPEGLRPAPPLR